MIKINKKISLLENDFYTIKQFAAEYDVKISTVGAWIQRGKFAGAVRIRNTWLIPKTHGIPKEKKRGRKPIVSNH